MTTIADASELVWVRPDRFDPVHELRDGQAVLATLRYARRLGTEATGDCGDRRWRFTWHGWLKPRIRARSTGGHVDDAVVTLPVLGWSGRPWLVRLADGQPLAWAVAGRVGLDYTFRSGERELIRFSRPLIEPQYHRDGKRELRVTVAELARTRPDLPLLLVLGRYLAR